MKNWNEITLYGFDVAECTAESHLEEFFAALDEFRDHGTMAGYYFSESARDRNDGNDGEAPAIDWTGYPLAWRLVTYEAVG